MRGRCRGLTLIEFLIVIAVIAILAAILVPIIAQKTGKTDSDQYQKASELSKITWVVTEYHEGLNEEGVPIRWVRFRDPTDQEKKGRITMTSKHPQYDSLHELVSPPGTRFMFRLQLKNSAHPGTTRAARWLTIVRG